MRPSPRFAPRTSRWAAGQLIGLAAGLGVLGSAQGCGSDPSFSISWAIAQDFETIGDAVVPESPAQCTALGIDGVQVITRQEGVTVDDRTFDCFTGGPVFGPELAAGSYDVEVLGLRRSLDPWLCELDEGYIGDPGCTGARGCACTDGGKCDANLSCAAQFSEDGDEILERFCEPCTARDAFVLEIDGSKPAIDAALISPPQCDDGIDNDADGLTDALDPACASDPAALESADFTETVIGIEVTFLNNNLAAECVPGGGPGMTAPLGVSSIGLEVRDSGDAIVASFEEVCRRKLRLLRSELPDGQYTLDVVGLGPSIAAADPLPLTVVKRFDFSVMGGGAFVSEDVDFRGEDFLTPIVGSVGALFEFIMGPTLDSPAGHRGCAPVGGSQASQLVIDELALVVRDIDGDPVDPASLGFMGGAVDPMNPDAYRLACQGTILQSASLNWGSYAFEAQGFVGGELCFEATQPQDLLPNVNELVLIPRVLVDGRPPAGCEDCITSSDCIDPSAPICEDNLCVPAA